MHTTTKTATTKNFFSFLPIYGTNGKIDAVVTKGCMVNEKKTVNSGVSVVVCEGLNYQTVDGLA